MASTSSAATAPRSAAVSQSEQLLAHTVCYAATTCPIKDDVVQLAACWKTGTGPLTRQEAGLLLQYHSSCGRGEEVLGAGVAAVCLDVLDSSTTLPADKSTAAGLLLSLCADDKSKEQVAKSKASGANGATCCAVLHACLANPEASPRHVTALLSSLASCSVSLPVLLKALTSGGEVPWCTYIRLLNASHKDHATTIDTARLIQSLTAERAVLAADAAAAGVLEALLAAAAAHKSAAAVCAAASCMLTLCLAAPELRERLGKLPGAVGNVVDWLGPPPATVIAWEQQQLKLQQQQQQMQQQQQPALASSSSNAAAALAAAEADPQGRRSPHHTCSSSIRIGVAGGGGGGGGNSSQHVRLSEPMPADFARGGSRCGTLLGDEVDTQADGLGKEQTAGEEQQGAPRTRRKSLRILNVAEGEAALGGPPPAPSSYAPSSTGDALSPTLRSKSVLGCIKQGAAATSINKAAPSSRSTCANPTLRSPPLSINSTALKRESPVPEATRAAAAGLIAQLVQLPHLREAVADRLAAPRLAGLLNTSILQLSEASGKKGKSGGGKKGGSKLVLPAGSEQLLTHICVALDFLVAADNTDCYRVAAAGCLPALVQLASSQKNTQLRRAAKATLAQVLLLGEASVYVREAAVPEELVVLQEGGQAAMRLRDADVRQLLVEFPQGAGLQVLDEITARARS